MSASTASDPFLELLQAKDPAPLVHRLRAEDPVHFVPSLGFWFVTRHDDVKRLFNDPENATQDRGAWEHYVAPPEGSMLRWFHDNNFARQGPEAHARFRIDRPRDCGPLAIEVSYTNYQVPQPWVRFDPQGAFLRHSR